MRIHVLIVLTSLAMMGARAAGKTPARSASAAQAPAARQLGAAELPQPGPTRAAPAQQTSVTQAVPSFRSESELVVLHVAVRDKRGHHVTGLPPQAFHIFEDGRAQPVRVFTQQADPVTIGLILDVSGSMAASRNRLLYAASQFARGGSPEDEVFALLVGDSARAVLPEDAPFTSDATALHDAISRNLRSGGRTALYDAIDAGLEYLSRGTHARRALVILSDGLDNASDTTFDDVLRRTQSSNAAIYAIGLLDPIHLERHPRELRRLARASGGDVYFPDDHAETYEAMEAVARDIRNSYAIGFVPAQTAHDGRFHRLRVTVSSPDGARLDIRAREGYTAGTQDGSH
ncbi:MAG: VWA domain-containing protein [Vicinamibacterales bacterium]